MGTLRAPAVVPIWAEGGVRAGLARLIGGRRGPWRAMGRPTFPGQAVFMRRFVPAPVAVSSREKDGADPPFCARARLAVASSDARARLLDGSPSRLNTQSTEELLEKYIYRCRFFTMLGVLGSLVGSVLCFLKGCGYVATSFMEYFTRDGKIMSVLIEAIDIYLIGTVMLVFGMGLYGLFISNLDIAKISSQRSNFLGLFMLQERPKWLEIQSVNELKTKLGHVMVMVLLVGLFDKTQKVAISTPKDLLCFTASILLASGGLFLLAKLAPSKHK